MEGWDGYGQEWVGGHGFGIAEIDSFCWELYTKVDKVLERGGSVWASH